MNSDFDAILDELNRAYPCRELQFSTLHCVLGHSFPSPSAMCLTGLPGSGKSTITRAFLEAFEIEFVWVACAETFTPALLFDRIVQGLRNLGGKGESSVRMSDDINNFVIETRKALKGLDGKMCLVSHLWC